LIDQDENLDGPFPGKPDIGKIQNNKKGMESTHTRPEKSEPHTVPHAAFRSSLIVLPVCTKKRKSG